jgi:hypothetical protein
MEQYMEFYIGGAAVVLAGLLVYINKLFSYKKEAKVKNVEQPVFKKPRKPRTIKAETSTVKLAEVKKPASTRGRKPKVAVVEVKKPVVSTRGRKPKAVEVPIAKPVKPRTKKS